jgi:very-short-patch-repair endonuclease
MGLYVVDIVCIECRLVIKLDGEQHLGSAADVWRDAWLRPRGFYVLWFWDREVLLALSLK